MRSMLKAGFVVAFAATLLFANVPISAAQQVDEVIELRKQVTELLKVGRYADAVPIAQQILAICEATLGPNHPATQKYATFLSELETKNSL